MNTSLILKVWSRYLFYSFIGLISSFIRKFIFSFYHKYNKYNINQKSIAVCGRGFSANKFFKSEYNLHNKLYLANYKNEDLTLKDYLKLINKELVLVSNIIEVMPNIFLLYFIKISEIIISQPNVQLKKSLGKSKRNSYKLNLLGVQVRGVEKGKYLDIYGKNENLNKLGTGIFAIYEAAEYAMQNKIYKIYLYGFDFYCGPKNKLTLLRDDFHSEEQYLGHRNDYIHLSESLDSIVKKYPKICFINNTFNLYKFTSSNLKTEKIDFNKDFIRAF